MYPNVVYYQTVGDDLCGDTGVLSVLVPHRMCVFNIYIVDTDENSYDGIHTQFFLSQYKRHKKAKHLES